MTNRAETVKAALDGDIILAIETGIAAGSISLWINERETDFWIGEGGVSKSEDVLEAIREILRKNNLEIESIDLLAVSSGPGSFTGLRIGAALAKGLSKAFDCDIKTAPLLEAMIVNADKNTVENTVENHILVVAVPFGKTQICWQLFETDSKNTGQNLQTGKPSIICREEFALKFENLKARRLILHNSLYEEFAAAEILSPDKAKIIVNAGCNLAGYIGEVFVKTRKQNGREEIRNLPITLNYVNIF